MVKQKSIKRLALVTCQLVMLVLPVSASAWAAETSSAATCASFEHVQTYHQRRGFFRAAAWSFRQPVTITYVAERCVTEDLTTGRRTTRLLGTATIASLRNHQQLGTFPFSSTETSSLGQDVAWWQCGRSLVDSEWVVEGIYRFKLTGRGGGWTYSQAALAPERVRRQSASFDACKLPR